MYKPVIEFNAFNGTINKIYYCATEAANQLDISYYQMLRLISTQQKYKHKFYNWYNAEEKPINIKPIKVIQQYDKDSGKIINQFKTILEAAEFLSYNRNAISKCINNNVVDKFGYYWRKNMIC